MSQGAGARGAACAPRRLSVLAAVAAATLVAFVGGGVVPAAHAVVGPVPAGAVAAATVKIDTAGDPDAAPGQLRERSCSGALVSPRWLITAASCFADSGGAPVAAGLPTWATTATVGRTDLGGSTGHVVTVDLVVPHPERDVVLVRLASAVADLAPVVLASTPPMTGDTLTVAGYGRTATELVPDTAHSASFRVSAVGAATFDIQADDDATLCKGDAGGPTLRTTSGGGVELVGVHHTSYQGGCLGATSTRRDATETRVDDLRGWIGTYTDTTSACGPVRAATPASAFGDGQLIRTPDGTISVVAGGAKHPLSYAQWSAMGLRGYTDVSDATAASLGDVPRDGTFLRNMDTGEIHQIIGGTRYRLASVAEWRSIGAPGYVDVPPGFVTMVPDTAPAGPVLLRDPATGTIHQVVGCSRYLLSQAEWQALQSPGYVQAPAALIERVPGGAPTGPAFLRDRTDGSIYQVVGGARYLLSMAEWQALGVPAYTDVPRGLLGQVTATVPSTPVLLRDVATGATYEVVAGLKRPLTASEAPGSQAPVTVPAGWLAQIPDM